MLIAGRGASRRGRGLENDRTAARLLDRISSSGKRRGDAQEPRESYSRPAAPRHAPSRRWPARAPPGRLHTGYARRIGAPDPWRRLRGCWLLPPAPKCERTSVSLRPPCRQPADLPAHTHCPLPSLHLPPAWPHLTRRLRPRAPLAGCCCCPAQLPCHAAVTCPYSHTYPTSPHLYPPPLPSHSPSFHRALTKPVSARWKHQVAGPRWPSPSRSTRPAVSVRCRFFFVYWVFGAGALFPLRFSPNRVVFPLFPLRFSPNWVVFPLFPHVPSPPPPSHINYIIYYYIILYIIILYILYYITVPQASGTGSSVTNFLPG